MRKLLISLSIFIGVLFLSGCGSGTSNVVAPQNVMPVATVIKTEDGGGIWNAKIKMDDKKTIAGINVLSMAIDPNDQNIIYIGTDANGLFVTKDGAETWTQVAFANKVYGLVFDSQNSNTIYASGVLNGRGKIYKRLAEDQEWKEIYTEPSDGTIILSLAIDNKNPQILYAGTSAGVIIKTTDGGKTWINLKKANGPIIGIVFNSANDLNVFFGIFQQGVLETTDGGTTIEDITKKISTTSVYTIVSDPYNPGILYIGTGGGIFRRSNDGTWSALNIIESSKLFPVRAIAVNPKNSKEIMYCSAKAIYKSIDNGETWSTFQLETTKEISVLRYVQPDPAKIYAGLRSF